MSTSSNRRERRRHEREERHQRLAALAARLALPTASLVWRAGWGSRALGALWLGQLVAFGPLSYDRDLTDFGAVDWFFRIWATVFSGWIFGRLCAWRVTADTAGVWIPRLWKVQHIAWDQVGTVHARGDGIVVLKERSHGPFLPPRLAHALGRPATATAVADHLTIMAHTSALRPAAAAGRGGRGLPYAVWALAPFVVLATTHLLQAWR